MKYFENIKNLDELRTAYRKLLKKFHPDNQGGSEEATKAINAEYDILFKTLKNGAATDQQETKYNYEADEALREVLKNIINLDFDIEVIGSWIWCSGNTYAYKDQLKENGFRWANSKKMWYFHTEEYHKKSKKSLNIEDIRNYYGSQKVNSARAKALEA